MRVLSDPIRLKVAQALYALIDKNLSLGELYHLLSEPPNLELGDLAFPCFQIGKVMKKNPALLATEFQTKFADCDFIQSVRAVGPYLNFKFHLQFLGQQLVEPILQETFFKRELLSIKEKTMIEFSQPNTHKELHVGHMRNACLGDSLIHLYKYTQQPVISSTFPGDVGTHVAKCLWYLKYHNREKVPEMNKGEWLGKIYSIAHLKLEDEEKGPKATENKKVLTEILHQLESGQGEFYKLWQETRAWSIELMQQVYLWLNIQFDHWYWESQVDSASIQYVKELFNQGKLQKSEGAIGFDLSADNLGFCMLLKSDGAGLYATKDLELAKRKFLDFEIDKSIYVVDMRQALHFKQIFRVLELLGFPQAKKCFHLQYNFVELPDGAMSSRKGNIVPIMQLVNKMEKHVRDNYLNRYKDEWTQEEVDLVARQVAQGAIKYGMLKIDTNKKIVFDMQEWLKIDGDAGPFIQYSAARINSLSRKFAVQNKNVNWTLLEHASERNVMQALLNFNQVVLQATETYRPSVVCTYLFDLAKRFNLFYHECSIGQAESIELKDARLALSQAVGKVLHKGLGLLGVPTPERM